MVGSVLERFQLPTGDVAFVENRGQWADEVQFLAQMPGASVWVMADGLVYDIYETTGTATRRGRVVEVKFAGGRAQRVEGVGAQPGYRNYLLGDDPSAWATDVPLYDEVVLREVYAGVSLRIYEADGALRQEFVLAPNTDLEAVQIVMAGAEGLDLAGAEVIDRAAVLGTAFSLPGPLSESAAQAGRGIGFGQSLGGQFLGSRFLGGERDEFVRSLALDANNAVYFGGRTKSAEFPTPGGYDQERQGGRDDAFLAQVSADGTQLYGTYIGGDREDEVVDVAYANESVYLTGVTQSPDFPTTPGAYEEEGSGDREEDAFVMRLRTDGSGPVFSTYLGGSGDAAGEDDAGTAIAVTPDGSVVVGGRTESENFPAPNGAYDNRGDAFVVVLSGDGTSVLGGTFLGGNQLDVIRALELGNGAMYVAGDTRSGNFSDLGGTYGGNVDAFVVRLSESGNTILGGTFIGGSDLEGAIGTGGNDRTGTIALALGDDGTVYVSGDTESTDFPDALSIGPRGAADAFVTRLAADATTILGSTVFGGSGIDRARGIALGPDGTIHLAGETASADFPVENADDPTYNQQGDAFVIQLTEAATEVLYGTYLGGSDADAAFDLAVGTNGITYVVGETRSEADFPVSEGSPPYAGGGDAFVAAYDLNFNPPPTVENPLADIALTVGAAPFTASLADVFADPDGEALTYACSSSAPGVASVGDCADGTLTVTAVAAGEATVTVTATDPGGASASDTFVVTVTENLPPVVVAPPEDATLVLGDAPLVLDLAGIFDDPEGEVLVYTCSSSVPSVALTSGCPTGTLTVTALSAGMTTITVTASDGFNPGVSTSFVFTVVPANAPPTVESPIPDATLALGDDPLVVDLSTVFTDPDGDDLTYVCSSSMPGVATVSGCASGALTVTAASAGTTTVTVTASDPAEASVSDAFVVTVTNPPPVVVSAIPDVSLELGDAPFTTDLATVFTDPNGDGLTYVCSSSAPSVAAVSGCATGTLTVTPLTAGSTTVTVTASDGSGSASDAFVVTVTNPPPVVANPIADVPIRLGGNPLTVDLATVFTDPNGDALTYTCSSGTPSVATVGNCSGGTLTVAAVSVGMTTITVTASDGSGSASDTFVVTVTENLPPVVADPPGDATLVLGEEPLVFDLTEVFTDPEGNSLTFSCSSSVPSVASVSDCASGTLTVTALSVGTTTITATANDGVNPDVSTSFVVTVVPDNRPPVVSTPIPDAALALGDEPLVVDLVTVFVDPDGDDLTFVCSSSMPGVAAVSGCVDGMLTVTPLAVGAATITVTAADGSLSATDVFAVTVTNPPPVVVRPIPDFPLLLGAEPFEVDLDTVFVDPNGDGLAYSFSVDANAVQLALDGSVLLVTPSALGAAEVTVTASDGSGTVSDAFVVTVTNNLPPVVVDPPGDMTLVLGEAPLSIDIGGVFEDPEGSRLSFGCSSSVVSVAVTSGCSNGQLTVTAVGPGVTLVTLTASDGLNPGVSVSFTVTVTRANRAPTVVNPLANATVLLSDPPLLITLAGVFDDADGDALSYTCSSDMPSVASVDGCSDGTLTVTAQAEGTATITVSASDPEGARATDAFVLTVGTNAPPVLDNPLADVAFALGDGPLVVDLEGVFDDPEGETLSYVCQSSAPGVAAVSGCSGGVLIVTPQSEGAATITVTASDPEGASTADAFAATVGCGAATIVAVTASPRLPEQGESVTITAITGGAQNALLRYREGGSDTFLTVAMAPNGNQFVATIPGERITERGVQYYVDVESSCGAASQSDPSALSVLIPAGIVSPVLPASVERGGYRLVSVPLALEEDGARAVLEDFGAANEGWLLLDLLPPGETGPVRAPGTDNQWYQNDASSISMMPGSGYWLIARDGGRFNTGAGTTIAGAEPFVIDIHSGWNLVGAPFGYDVPLSRIRMESGAPLQLQAYGGQWRNESAGMTPFQGYALYADADDRLLIEPLAEVAPRPVARSDARQAEKEEGGWAVDIIAEIGQARDGNNTALVTPSATEVRDAADWVEPPLVGDYVSVSFASPAAGRPPLTIDARPVPDEGASWPVTVRSNLEGRISLAFEGLDSVPEDYVVWLVDEAAASVRDLRRTPGYAVSSQGNGAPVQMQLVIGTPAYAQAATGFDAAIPSDFGLSPSYPNPFRSVSTIQYALPRAERVVIEVFDVVGRRVATLVDEDVEAGFHSVVWDGRGASGGADLASGVYIYRLRAGSFTATQRAVLVR